MSQKELLEEKMYKLLKDIASKSDKNFSGIGIVAYNSENFPKDCYCDLRPEFKLEKINMSNPEITNKLLEYTDYKNTLHDGFCLLNEDGELTHVAQYFVPKIVSDVRPNQEHGVRTYSAACGSKMQGVNFIGMISCNNEIYLYKDGKEIVHDTQYINKGGEVNEN